MSQIIYVTKSQMIYKPIDQSCFNSTLIYSRKNNLCLCFFMCGNVLDPRDRQGAYFYRVSILALGVRKQKNIQMEEQDNFKQK